MISEQQFDQKADALIQRLEQGLLAFDPDELEANVAFDVLTIVVQGQHKIIINKQRPTQQIWMAAFRHAWHFDYDLSSDQWKTVKTGEELSGALEGVLSKQLGRAIRLT